MKNLKKLAALVLAMLMMLSLVPSFAEEVTTGSITVSNPSAQTEYNIYKIFDLTSYDRDENKYSYKVVDAWAEFFAAGGEGANYIEVSETGFSGKWIGAETDMRKADFAKAALAYAKKEGIAPSKSNKNDGEFTINSAANTGTFTNLDLGYYLVDSNAGALCGLTTANPHAALLAKNGQPTLTKDVKEDSINDYTTVNSTEIGTVVDFRVKINVHAGAENYILHDVMDDGFTFIPTIQKTENGETTTVSNVVVKHIDISAGDEEHDMKSEYYNVVVNPTDGCEFHIEFTEAAYGKLDENNYILAPGDKIVVYYHAKLNDQAVIADNNAENAVAGNDFTKNTAWMTFGEGDHKTKEVQTRTYTYSVDIVKTDSSNALIDGAEFKIYASETGTDEVPVKLVDKTENLYHVLTPEEIAGGIKGVNIVVTKGLAKVEGFDNGVYYLAEIVTPEGYNPLVGRQKFTIADASLTALFPNDVYSTGTGVQVVNHTGAMLPETGGIGTTLFYAVGAALVIGAVVLLITKKRMSNEE